MTAITLYETPIDARDAQLTPASKWTPFVYARRYFDTAVQVSPPSFDRSKYVGVKIPT